MVKKFSVTVPIDLAKKIEEKMFSPTKMFKVGVEIALSGGINYIHNLRKENERMKMELDLKLEKVKFLEKRNESLKEELSYIQNKYIKGEVRE